MHSQAWDDLNWVTAVMLYPREMRVFETLERALEFFKTRDEAKDTSQQEEKIRAGRNQAGQVAGTVLLALYEQDRSGQRSSLSRVIAEMEKWALRSGDPSWPRGHTKIEECFNAMRSVAHLWAAERQSQEFLRRDLLKALDGSDEGLHTLLGLASTLQRFALDWTPERTNPGQALPPLLGESPWLIPDDIVPLSVQGGNPKWSPTPYKRRRRGR